MVLFMPFGVRVFARPMRYCHLALQKCSATPDLSTFLLIMSRLCSLNLSFCRLLVCPMYWQFLCPLVKQRLHCKA